MDTLEKIFLLYHLIYYNDDFNAVTIPTTYKGEIWNLAFQSRRQAYFLSLLYVEANSV